jgi:hypothetical protein
MCLPPPRECRDGKLGSIEEDRRSEAPAQPADERTVFMDVTVLTDDADSMRRLQVSTTFE